MYRVLDGTRAQSTFASELDPLKVAQAASRLPTRMTGSAAEN